MKQPNVDILIGLVLLSAALGLAFHKAIKNDLANERAVQVTGLEDGDKIN